MCAEVGEGKAGRIEGAADVLDEGKGGLIKLSPSLVVAGSRKRAAIMPMRLLDCCAQAEQKVQRVVNWAWSIRRLHLGRQEEGSEQSGGDAELG